MSRRAQPYRRSRYRRPSKVLDAMRRGASAFGQNPMNARRAMQRKARRQRRAR